MSRIKNENLPVAAGLSAEQEELIQGAGPVEARQPMTKDTPLNTIGVLKRGILGFWSLWFSIVVVTNVYDAAKSAGVLGEGWTFASDNYAAIVRTTSKHHFPLWINPILFAAVILLESTIAALFWRAFLSRRGPEKGAEPDADRANVAFAVSFILWGGFLLIDELFIAYSQEKNHMIVFITALCMFMIVNLLGARDALPGQPEG
jgi:hypothetical protein